MALVGGGLSRHHIDFGNQAPLTVSATAGTTPARRAISVRWLSGTILTGLTAFALMGGALTVALNGQQLVAGRPRATDRRIFNANLIIGQKGDRILPVASPPTTREMIPSP